MRILFGPQSFDWIDPAINLGAVFLGAALAWGTSYFFESNRLKDERKGIAYSLIFKVLFYADEIWKFDQQIAAALDRAKRDGQEGPLWSKLPDVVGFNAEPERITAQELALVADTRHVELVMKILELESGHSILMSATRKIEELRSKLADLKLATAVKGRIVSFGGPIEDYPNYAHIFINLNDLSEGLEEQTSRIARNASYVAGTVGQHLKSHFKFKHFVILAMSPTSTVSKDVDGENTA